MKKYTLHLREIRVVPVTIEANSLAEAKELLCEGGGDYHEENAYHSSLTIGDILNNVFETGYVGKKEINFKKLNE